MSYPCLLCRKTVCAMDAAACVNVICIPRREANKDAAYEQKQRWAAEDKAKAEADRMPDIYDSWSAL